MDVAFRKIDIDAFDEDVLLESELYDPDPRDPAQIIEEAKAKASAVRGSLSKYVHFLTIFSNLLTSKYKMCRGDIAGALMMILDNAPYGPHVDEAKASSPHSTSIAQHPYNPIYLHRI